MKMQNVNDGRERVLPSLFDGLVAGQIAALG